MSQLVSEGFLLHYFVPSILKVMGTSEFLFEQVLLNLAVLRI